METPGSSQKGLPQILSKDAECSSPSVFLCLFDQRSDLAVRQLALHLSGRGEVGQVTSSFRRLSLYHSRPRAHIDTTVPHLLYR